MKYFHLILFSILVSLLLLLASAHTARAQQAGEIDFYLDAGVAFPAAPSGFTQSWKAGWGFGAGASYEVRPSVKLQLHGQYHRFSFDEDGARSGRVELEDVTLAGGSAADMFNVMLNAIYEYGLPQVPTLTYLSIGGGFFRTVRPDFDIRTPEETITIEERSQSSFGVNAAVGLRHALSRGVSVYAEGKFVTNLFVDRRTQYFPLSVGIMF